MPVGAGWTIGVGVGSACSQARSATASARLSTKAPTMDAVLDCADAETIARVSLRKPLENEAGVDDESIA